MTRRTGLLLGLVVAVVVASGAVGGLLLTRGGSEECPVTTTALHDEQGQLVPLEELLPEGSVGAERRPVVTAVQGLGGPFGTVLAGRFYEQADQVPSLVPAGDALGLATAGSVHLVDVPSGAPRWGRSYDEGAARGGLVGEAFVVLVGGTTAAVVSLDAGDGSPQGCVPVPVSATGDVETLLTDQAGTDVVVAAAPPAAPVTLSRIDPAGGDVRWQRRLDGVTEAGAVTVAGASAVVSRVGPDPVRLAEMASAGGIGSPMVTAYSLEDGSSTWSFPAPDDVASVAATVVGHHPETGTTLVLTAVAGPGTTNGTDPKQTRVALVALDDTGAEVWREPLGRGFWGGSLWGALTVVQGPDPQGGAVLRAFSVTDGAERWTLRSRSLPEKGDRPRRGFGVAVPVGDDFVLPAPNGLVVVDPGSGGVDRLDSAAPIDQLLPVGEVVVLRTGRALLVVERRAVSPARAG